MVWSAFFLFFKAVYAYFLGFLKDFVGGTKSYLSENQQDAASWLMEDICGKGFRFHQPEIQKGKAMVLLTED